jgi:hypothetical protein
MLRRKGKNKGGLNIGDYPQVDLGFLGSLHCIASSLSASQVLLKEF